MFRITKRQMRGLSTFTSKYPKGKIALVAYRAVREPLRNIFGTVSKGITTAQNTIRWLNGVTSVQTGIPLVDESMNMLQNDPVYKDVAVNVDSFYTQIEDLGHTEQEINRIIEGTFQSLGVTLSPEEQVQISKDYKEQVIQGGVDTPLETIQAPLEPANVPVQAISAPVSAPPRASITGPVQIPEKTKKGKYIRQRLNTGGKVSAPANPLTPFEKTLLKGVESVGRFGSLFNPVTRAGLVGGSSAVTF